MLPLAASGAGPCDPGKTGKSAGHLRQGAALYRERRGRIEIKRLTTLTGVNCQPFLLSRVGPRQ